MADEMSDEMADEIADEMADEIADEMKIEFVHAATYGDIDRVRELLDMGVKPNIKIRFNSYTALILASIGGYTDVVTLLFSRDTDPNIQNRDGYTALMYSSMYGYIDIVRLLLDRDANPYISNNSGEIALDFAEMRGYNEIIDVFKRHAAKITLRKYLRRKITRRIKTLRARQRSALSRFSIADDLTEKISNYLDSISYNPDIIRRIKQEGQGQEEEINIYY